MDARFILLGPPASGKGTQGRLLAELTGARYFSTGRQLRREMEQGTSLGAEAKVFLEQGNYVPDAMALELATRWLREVEGPWILDGFPRTKVQALALDTLLGEDAEGLRAISLSGTFEELSPRVLSRVECSACSWLGGSREEGQGSCPDCGAPLVARQDDEEENFRSRWNAYEELTKPAVDYYVESQRLIRVSGEGPPEEVFSVVRERLGI